MFTGLVRSGPKAEFRHWKLDYSIGLVTEKAL
jgi:hypothetical protein